MLLLSSENEEMAGEINAPSSEAARLSQRCLSPPLVLLSLELLYRLELYETLFLYLTKAS